MPAFITYFYRVCLARFHQDALLALANNQRCPELMITSHKLEIPEQEQGVNDKCVSVTYDVHAKTLGVTSSTGVDPCVYNDRKIIQFSDLLNPDACPALVPEFEIKGAIYICSSGVTEYYDEYYEIYKMYDSQGNEYDMTRS